MSGPEITNEVHLPRGSRKSIQAALGLTERLQSGIAFGLASQGIVARGGLPESLSRAESGKEFADAARERVDQSSRGDAGERIQLQQFDQSRITAALAEMTESIERFEKYRVATSKLGGMKTGTGPRLIAIDDPGIDGVLTSANQSRGLNAAPRIAEQSRLPEWLGRNVGHFAAHPSLQRAGSINAGAMREAAISGARISGLNRTADTEDRSRERGDDRTRLFDAASVAAQSREFATPRMVRAEFDEPAKARRSRGEAEQSPAISIHSAPTVIIHGGDARNDIERQVASALRKHREQLYDDMQQEAGRRERAEY